MNNIQTSLLFSGPYNTSEIKEKFNVLLNIQNYYYFIFNINNDFRNFELVNEKELENIMLEYNIPMFQINKNSMDNLIKENIKENQSKNT